MKVNMGLDNTDPTILQIYKYIQEITSEINNKKHAVGLSLDFTKAYDIIT